MCENYTTSKISELTAFDFTVIETIDRHGLGLF